MERGIEKAAEHGPGVGGSIGRLTRVRPLLRFEAELSANQGGTAFSNVLGLFVRGLFCLLKPECLHTDGRKLSQAARGHQPYPLHYVSKVGAVFALRFCFSFCCYAMHCLILYVLYLVIIIFFT